MDRPNDTNMLDTLTMIIEDEDNPTELINAARVVMKYPDVVRFTRPNATINCCPKIPRVAG